MNSSLILWPVLAQVLLTLVVIAVLGARRLNAVKTRQVNVKKAVLDNRAWPDSVLQASNNLANQFEVPVLFYVLSLILYSAEGVGLTVLVLAWVFVLSRYIHAFIHLGSNYVPARFGAFIFGCFMLLGLTCIATWELALSAGG